MAEPLTIFLAGGGTGGHLYPGIAVAEAMRAVLPDVRPVFLCTQREIDAVILKPTGFEFIPQPIVPPVSSVGGLLKFYKSWRETKDLVKQLLTDRRPAAVLGLGGYAAGVAVKKAAAQGIPTAVLNPDVIPGKANKFLMSVVKAVCCQFEATSGFVGSSARGKLQMTGCPIRSDITAPPPRDEAAKRLGIDPMLKTLVVTGASLGARTVNEAVLTMLGGMSLRGWQVLHLSGREHADAVRAGYRDLSVTSRVIDFTPAMADVWAATDLAISRSGASSCAELTACGIPSILMPYPYHRDMHQKVNAEQLVSAGGAVLLDDEKDRAKNAAKLQPVIEQLMYDAGKRQKMADAAKAIGKPDAAERVARLLVGLAS
ncbi:UDP-N-acetylglucosamine--N-acetylmuramyl-(pentapeptide) pyrophosphoryl-undecaprenol N-acetylglucosamine transferase [Humisphaera borealis]|uniref:UDP-N-acetylglucosamine--N-acetylmuramyl-(pentapeptide) pyrophosphoryl-undecaprenol N-acetylglucosamine transferase n=1 Tax=Humisphaera borealis TaxID=2807512 RepID=A0A7M2WU20_9BACT|nr:UDP-N-acetylglucosamine--N-acetylmuramyl-(pentapeptide) pyrophosphoryl-undecaprenol N-acetylglucosamine transferase [Humisphaera borealis]QOV89008.1 UDP-N-acetylglucosamine--N-acetylmuramyl-(pentapeptide) pyrophosphoryl-undecaprenol N-acetylglucosamine transferase [Humisphaera borealis]